MKKRAVYPGTFDPITNGHIDLIKRGLTIFDEIVVAVAYNPFKHPLFTAEERLSLIKNVTDKMENVHVETFSGLLIDYVKSKGINVIIKGIRAVSDFEYEFKMALMNRTLDPTIEMIYLMPAEEYSFISSSLIKEVAFLDGKINRLVPTIVAKAIKKKIKRFKENGDQCLPKEFLR